MLAVAQSLGVFENLIGGSGKGQGLLQLVPHVQTQFQVLIRNIGSNADNTIILKPSACAAGVGELESHHQ